MVNSSVEHAIRIVPSNCSFDWSGKARLLRQSVDIDSMEEVTTVLATFDLVRLVLIGLCRQIPSVSGGINNASCLFNFLNQPLFQGTDK